MTAVVKKILILTKIICTRQFLKYIFVGVINTVVYYGIYYALLKLGFFYAWAVTLGTLVGILNSFLWNKHFTFKTDKKSLRVKIKFVTVYGVQYLFNLLFIYLGVNLLGISAERAGLLAVCIGVFISYFGHKYWSFR